MPAFRWQGSFDNFVAARLRSTLASKTGGHNPRDDLPTKPHTPSITTPIKKINEKIIQDLSVRKEREHANE
jgi:hypothetical protein